MRPRRKPLKLLFLLALPTGFEPLLQPERVAIPRLIDSSTHSPGGGKTVSVPSTLVFEPHERCRPNDYQITTRGKASCCPDGCRSVRRERCADLPRQADRPVGSLRCRST